MQNISDAGVTFPCYYSQLNPWMVMESYDYDETLNNVLASIAIPNGLYGRRRAARVSSAAD